MHTSTARFHDVFLRSDNRVGLSIVSILAWIAASDGRISEEEANDLRRLTESGSNVDELQLAIECAKETNIRTLQLACEVIRHLDEDSRALFLQMAIGMAVADGYLAVSENHLLRFMADLLCFGPTALESIFEDVTNRPLPSPGDPSTVEWWDQREAATSGSAAGVAGGDSSNESTTARSDGTDVHAWAVLGLEPGASVDEIRSTYRRLAHIHHPDRYSSLGPEAVQAATITFQRIQRAYEYLMQS